MMVPRGPFGNVTSSPPTQSSSWQKLGALDGDAFETRVAAAKKRVIIPIATLALVIYLAVAATVSHTVGRLIRGAGVTHEIFGNNHVAICHWDRVRAGGALGLFKRLLFARGPRSFDRRWRSGRARHRRDIAWHETVEDLAAIVS